MKKVLFCGNHAGSTAYVVIKNILKRGFNWDISWIGAKYATENKKGKSLEYNFLPPLGVNFFSLESGRLQTKYTRHTIPAFVKIPFGFIHAGILVARIKPDTVVSFGGATGAYVSFWAWVMKIPVIIHEQTSKAGRANIISSKFANTVSISRKSSAKLFPAGKTVLTGNPINQGFSEKRKRSVVKNIVVTGGSRGSRVINEVFYKLLPHLTDKYSIVHQVGEGNINNKFFDLANYKVIEQTDPDSWVKILKKADLVISRSGANSVAEFMSLGIPSILIPLPFSYLDEQGENARMMEKTGLARVIKQKDLNEFSLMNEITYIVNNYQSIVKKYVPYGNIDLEATDKIIDIIKKGLKICEN